MAQFSNKSKRDLTGFTLVETLLVMLLVLVFTGLTLANYKSGGKTLALQRSANQLAQSIRSAEQKAMSSAKCEECGGEIPKGGYGVFLFQDDDFYILYADINDDGVYDVNDTQIGDDIFLEKGVYVNDVPEAAVSINFKGPEPLITISDGSDKTTIELALKNTIPLKKIAVEVNAAGLIEVK